MVECTGLENQQVSNVLQGSNPCPSARKKIWLAPYGVGQIFYLHEVLESNRTRFDCKPKSLIWCWKLRRSAASKKYPCPDFLSFGAPGIRTRQPAWAGSIRGAKKRKRAQRIYFSCDDVTLNEIQNGLSNPCSGSFETGLIFVCVYEPVYFLFGDRSLTK